MRFLDALLGRTKPKASNLDALFALPSAAVTLEAATGLRPSGNAGVCFKPTGGQAFAHTAEELDQLLQLTTKDSTVETSRQDDKYGYRWVTFSLLDLSELVTTVHLVNATLQANGFGPQLLCSVFSFRPGDGDSGCFLVYLYKRGTFYPFAPLDGERRDNELELRLQGILAADLPTEQDYSRWFPLWGLPVR
ncbi:MAG: hypothetical protein M5U22_21510 [Thermoleophilia bacterium]|nr:hypothetical protein [Thermoleophilia bacterium]